MIRNIVQKGAPVLARKASNIHLQTDAAEAAVIARDLADTLKHLRTTREFTKGVGLAAPQIGYARRMFGLAPPSEDITIYINPVILEKSNDTDFQYEGCLSFFDVRGRVERSLNLRLQYFDLAGQVYETSFTAGNARIIQHEIDHIDGILYDEKMASDDSLIALEQYLEMKERNWHYVP